MGQKLETDKTCLVMGLKKQGKTLFLYTCVLRNTGPIGKLAPSTSYNYEIVVHTNDKKIGLWDIPGNMIWSKMRKFFYRNVPVNAIIYIIRTGDMTKEKLEEQQKQNQAKPADEDGITTYRTKDQQVDARKDLHFLMNEPELKDAELYVVFNEKVDKNGGDKTLVDKTIRQYKKMIKFNELPQQQKEAFVIDVSTWAEECEQLMDKVSNVKVEESS
jgi:hypothetical protein